MVLRTSPGDWKVSWAWLLSIPLPDLPLAGWHAGWGSVAEETHL